MLELVHELACTWSSHTTRAWLGQVLSLLAGEILRHLRCFGELDGAVIRAMLPYLRPALYGPGASLRSPDVL